MNKLIIVFLLTPISFCFSQFNDKTIPPFQQSLAVSFSPSLLVPVNLDYENRVGFGIQLGLQWNYSKNTSLCLDYDLAYSVIPGYDYGFGIYQMSVPSRWNTYMLLTTGIKFYLPLNEKLKVFFSPALGILSFRKRANQPELSPVLSFEFGAQYKLNNNFSAFGKLKVSPQIPLIGAYGFSPSLGGVALFNCGISYQF